MKETAVDYAAVFQSLPGMVALLTPELVYVDANEDFQRLSGRTRAQLVGRYIFDVFPDNPNDPAATGMRDVQASMLRVVATANGRSATGARSTRPSSAPTGRWR